MNKEFIYLVSVNDKNTQKLLRQFAVSESDLSKAVVSECGSDVVLIITSMEYERYNEE